MSSSTPETPLRTAAILTVSDSRFRGEQPDLSGPAIAEILSKNGFYVVAQKTIPDDQREIEKILIELCNTARMIVTTGGTGVAERDVTPEATRAVCERLVEGIAEQMRHAGSKQTAYAVLSRGVCGVRGNAVLLNLPGSPPGAVHSLESVVGLMPHLLDLLEGKTQH